MFIFFLVTAVALAADQLFKYLIITHMQLGQSLALGHGLVYLTYIKNPGGAFTILPHQTTLFVALGVVLVVVVILVCLFYPDCDTRLTLSLALLTGGVLGNLIDRVRTGYVTDFIDFRFWPVFNAADVFIFLGTISLFLILITAQETKKGM